MKNNHEQHLSGENERTPKLGTMFRLFLTTALLSVITTACSFAHEIPVTDKFMILLYVNDVGFIFAAGPSDAPRDEGLLAHTIDFIDEGCEFGAVKGLVDSDPSDNLKALICLADDGY